MDAFIEHKEENSQEKMQQIQDSLRLYVEHIVSKAATDQNKSVTSGYVNALTLFIFQFTNKCIARDLVAFRDHANRRTLSEDDVLLLARKNKYHEHLQRYLEDLGVTPKTSTRGRKKKV